MNKGRTLFSHLEVTDMNAFAGVVVAGVSMLSGS